MARHEQELTKAIYGKKTRIPTFHSIEEEAAFWDAHDSTEFEEEFTEVTDVQFVPAKPKKAISVRLDEESLQLLTREAREKGIGPSTLARMWILEQLKRNQSAK